MGMKLAAQVETPELDKRKKVALDTGASQVLTDFYDWLTQEKGYTLCEPVPGNLHGYYGPASYGGPEQLFAEFFGIDLDRVEAERRLLLDALGKPDPEEEVSPT